MLGNTFPSSVTSTPTSSLDKTRNDILSDPIIQINQNRHLNSLEDEFLPNRLPFGAARLEPHYKHQPSPSQSSAVSTRTSSNLHRTHHYSGSATLTENSSRHSHTSDSSRSHPFSGPDLKSKMMLQLLSSQAIIEASAFQILPFGRVEQLKKVCLFQSFNYPIPSSTASSHPDPSFQTSFRIKSNLNVDLLQFRVNFCLKPRFVMLP